jgi:hypothetical protein
VLNESGDKTGVFGVIRDVTELRAAERQRDELERQLMHSQKLEALGTLAGGVAHDLNNTLVPIVALSKLALEDLPEESPLRGDIETIIRASERARDLVKQILAFSRKEDLVRQEVDLVRVTRDALQMLRASLPAAIQIVDRILRFQSVWRCRRAASGDRQSGNQCGTGDRRRCRQDNGRPVGTAQRQSSPDEAGPAVCLSIAEYRLRHGCEATVERVSSPFHDRPSATARDWGLDGAWHRHPSRRPDHDPQQARRGQRIHFMAAGQRSTASDRISRTGRSRVKDEI